MGRPLVGVTTYMEEAQWDGWRMGAALLPAGYPRLVRDSGGIAALLPPDDPEVAPLAVARLDALVITGGPDVEPARYGAQPHPSTGEPSPERDAWELALLAAALERDIPLLGICRGMQLFNVAHGGTLIQHLPEAVGHQEHAAVPGVFGCHPVRTVAGTQLAELMPGTTSVPTHHHQAVDGIGRDLRVCAHAMDGTVEAVEHQHARFALGVQWHPEMADDLRVVRALIAAATS